MATSLLTARQVAEQLAVSQRFVYDLAARGELPSIRMGSVVRFDQGDVDNYLKACRCDARRSMAAYPGPPKVMNVRPSDPHGESELAAYFRRAGIRPQKRLSERPQRKKP